MTFLKKLYQPLIIYAAKGPLLVLLVFAGICIASYILGGWMMRPIGDDYVWLHNFHQSRNWIQSLHEFITTQNGRYAQNIFVAIPYGIFGKSFLRLVGIAIILLFFITCYASIRAYESISSRRLKLTKRQVVSASALLFLVYTSISVTYAYVKGNIDNSFQNILYYPGVVTYTLPFLFLGLLLSATVLYRHKIKSISSLLSLSVIAFLIGLFGETVPVLYILLLALMIPILYLSSKNIFTQLTHHIKPIISIGLGFLIAVLVTYFSPAGVYRRSIVKHTDGVSHLSLIDIITSASLSLHDQYQLVFGPESPIKWSIVIAIITGFCIHRYILKYTSYTKMKNRALIVFVASCVLLWAASIFISSSLYTVGYQTMGALTPPRFEILFNIWLALSFIGVGVLISNFLAAKLQEGRITWIVPFILTVVIVASTPYILNTQAKRLTSVVNFSQNWEEQNTKLLELNRQGADTVSVPLVDIGDGFSVTCDLDGNLDWLALAKQDYYGIPHICTEKTH